MKKRVNSRPEPAILRSYLQGWPLVTVWEFGFGKGSYNTQKIRVAHCAWTIYTNTIVSAKYLLSFWESGILVPVREKVPTWPASNKNPGWHLSLYWPSLVNNNISHMLPQLLLKRLAPPLCGCTGRGPFEAYTWFPLDFTPCAFSLCWFYFALFYCNKS